MDEPTDQERIAKVNEQMARIADAVSKMEPATLDDMVAHVQGMVGDGFVVSYNEKTNAIVVDVAPPIEAVEGIVTYHNITVDINDIEIMGEAEFHAVMEVTLEGIAEGVSEGLEAEVLLDGPCIQMDGQIVSADIGQFYSGDPLQEVTVEGFRQIVNDRIRDSAGANKGTVVIPSADNREPDE